jgi:putative membrane protein
MHKNHKVAKTLSLERTLLSAQRTFSAWIRTGLAALAGGLAITRIIIFKTLSHERAAHMAAYMLIVWAGGIFVLAYYDYKRLIYQLKQTNDYTISLWRLNSITFILLAVVVILLWVAIV